MPGSQRRDNILRAIDALVRDPALSESHRQELQRIRTDIERALHVRDTILIASLTLRLSNLITWILDHLPP